jgi:hypothetical protein
MTALINIPQYATQYYIISLSGADISGTTLHMTETQMAHKEQKEFFGAVQRITLIAQYETALYYENSIGYTVIHPQFRHSWDPIFVPPREHRRLVYTPGSAEQIKERDQTIRSI